MKQHKRLRFVSIVCLAALLVSCLPGAYAYGVSSAWAREELDAMAALDLIPALLEERGDLRENITRLEMCALAVQAYEHYTGEELSLPDETPFPDTNDPIAAKSYAAGFALGFIRKQRKSLPTRMETPCESGREGFELGMCCLRSEIRFLSPEGGRKRSAGGPQVFRIQTLGGHGGDGGYHGGLVLLIGDAVPLVMAPQDLYPCLSICQKLADHGGQVVLRFHGVCLQGLIQEGGEPGPSLVQVAAGKAPEVHGYHRVSRQLLPGVPPVLGVAGTGLALFDVGPLHHAVEEPVRRFLADAPATWPFSVTVF